MLAFIYYVNTTLLYVYNFISKEQKDENAVIFCCQLVIQFIVLKLNSIQIVDQFDMLLCVKVRSSPNFHGYMKKCVFEKKVPFFQAKNLYSFLKYILRLTHSVGFQHSLAFKCGLSQDATQLIARCNIQEKSFPNQKYYFLLLLSYRKLEFKLI